MTQRVERRYRALLRVLPAEYRLRWADEMVAALLESMRTGNREDDEYLADYGRPPWAEVASVLGLAVRLRLGGAGAPARYAVWGEAVRRVALIGLLANAILGTMSVAYWLWLLGALPLQPPADGRVIQLEPTPTDAPWVVGALLWLSAYLAAVLGRGRAARTLTALALLLTAAPALVVFGVGLVRGLHPGMVERALEALLGVVLLLALAAFHREAPPIRPLPWLIALPVGAAAPLTFGVLYHPSSGGGIMLVDDAGLWCLGVLGAALVHLAGRRTAPWALALAMLAAAAIIFRTVTALSFAAFGVPDRAELLAVAAAQVLALTAVAVPLARTAARALRATPTPAQS